MLDVGSNTVHLLVVDAHPGSHPDPVRSHKSDLRLAELIGPDGSLGGQGRDLLVKAVADAKTAAEEEGVDDLVAFASRRVCGLRSKRRGWWRAPPMVSVTEAAADGCCSRRARQITTCWSSPVPPPPTRR